MTPPSLVSVIPDKTEEPVDLRDRETARVLSSIPFSESSEEPDVDCSKNETATWEQNSTEIPEAMTRLTKERAFRDTFNLKRK